jgi:cytochrome c biogenesis protein ResB
MFNYRGESMKFLANKNLANLLVLLLAVYLMAAMIWPSAKLLDSPLLLILTTLFLINLSACTIKQISRRPKGRKLGLVALHLGMITVLGGVLINSLWGGEGILHLGVGQDTFLQSNYLHDWKGGPFLKEWKTDISLGLKSVNIEVKQDEVFLKNGELRYDYKNSEGIKRVNFNTSAKIGAARIWVRERGFAPILEWNQEVNFWGLQTKRNQTRDQYIDFQERNGYRLQAEYFPAGLDGRKGTMKLIVQGNNKRNTYNLKPGDNFFVGAEKVKWVDTSYWLDLNVKKLPGMLFVWGGSTLIILGSFIYFIPILMSIKTNRIM